MIDLISVGECVDMRKELCYMSYANNKCTNAMTQPQSKMVCCCSMGAAWGKICEACPKQGSRNIHSSHRLIKLILFYCLYLIRKNNT